MALDGETIMRGAPTTCPSCGTFVLPMKALRSGAGWYIGTVCNEGPYSRESADYYPTEADARAALGSGEWRER